MTIKRENPGKRGAKPYFVGSRQKLLEEHLEEYTSLKFKSRNLFWSEFFAKWWEKFPWKLDDQEEPPLDDPAMMSELASVTAGERNKKSGVESAVMTRIKQWFAYQSQNRLPRGENAGWFHLLQRLHESANPKPRKRSVIQQFMLEQPSLVDIEFVAKYGNGCGMDGTERMNKRYEVAKKLVESRYKHLFLDLESHARESHEKEVRQWSLTLDSIELAADVNIARDSLISATHSLLKAIGLYTGCYVTLIAAASPSAHGNQDYFSTVHYVPENKASRKNWTEWDTDGFRIGVARPFKKYIKSMETAPETATASNDVPPEDLPNCSTNPMAGLDGAPSSVAIPARSQPDITPRPNGPTAPKRTAAGKYKRRPIVYTEGGDSDEWSDHQSSDPEENSQKRPRTDTIVTRSRLRLPEGEVSDTSRGSPPDTSTLLRSPVLSSGHFVDPLDDVATNPPDSAGPDRNTPDAGQASIPSATDVPLAEARPASRPMPISGGIKLIPSPMDRESPLLTVPAIDTLSSTTTAEPTTATNDTGNTAAPPVDVILLKTNLHNALTTVIPPFLKVPQKKNKASIHSYLTSCQDPHFQNLLKVYVAFENAAVTSGQIGSLSTTKRPPCISVWIRCARVDTHPSWSSLHDYASSVIAWWSSLQPSWRKLECSTPCREEGLLDCLCQPGVNGLLNVVILAYWWSNDLTKSGTGSKTESSRYRWFVADVTWVISKLLGTVELN